MRTIAIVNQKGGCGKTTTAVNLAGCLAADGQRVLVVDLDPQAHATLALGIDPEEPEENLFEVLAEPDGAAALQRVILPAAAGIEVAPSGIVLSAVEPKLAAEPVERRTEKLAAALDRVAGDYDFALIDCPPNVGLLTFNALRAAGEVIVPLETSPFAIHGVQKLLDTIRLLAERLRHELSVRVLATLYDGRTRYARRTLGRIREQFGELCFDTVIRSNVKLREAAAAGLPICVYAPSAHGSQDYAALAIEVEAATPGARAQARAPAQAASQAQGGLEAPPEAAREVVVRYRDPTAADVRIAGDFNGWVPDKGVRSLVDHEAGARVWTKILLLPPGRYAYRYVVDGQWRCDPENPDAVAAPSGERSSLLVVR